MKTTKLALVATGALITVAVFQNCGKSIKLGDTDENQLSSLSFAQKQCESFSDSSQGACEQVHEAYRSSLKRDPATSELSYWTGQVLNQKIPIAQVRLALDSTVEARHVQELSVSQDRSFLWGAWLYGIPAEPGMPEENQATFNDLSQKVAPLVGFNTWWYTDNADLDFNKIVEPWANGVLAGGATPVLMWNAVNPTIVGACQSAGYLDRIRQFAPAKIASGAHDAYIRNYARQVKTWGRPIYMRIMHELNQSRTINNPCDYFTAWDAEVTIQGQRMNSRQDHINAWRHIVGIFRAEGATNARWIWSVLSAPSGDFGGGNPITLKSIYPGDAYVDWIGIECYNFEAHDYISCAERMRPIYNEAAALSATRPILNVEMGAIADPRKAAWITETFSTGSSNNAFHSFPRLTGLMYWQDSRTSAGTQALWIRSDKNSENSFRSAIRDSFYVSGDGSTSSSNCILDGFTLKNSASREYFKSSGAPNCAEISQVRTCEDGNLLGSPAYAFASCVKTLNAAEAKALAEKLLIQHLGRTPAEVAADTTGVAFWTSEIQSGRTESEVSAALLGSDEHYIRQAYLTYLSRRVDSEGLNFYLTELAAGRKTRVQVAADLKYSAQVSAATNASTVAGAPTPTPTKAPASVSTPAPATEASIRATITALLKSVMGRSQVEIDSDAAGMEFWAARMRAGASSAQIEAEFKNSDEYFVRQAFLSELRRKADTAGLQYFIGQLKSGAKTRAQVRTDLKYICTTKSGGECA